MDVVEELELDKEVLKRIEMIYKFTGVKDIIKQVSMNNYVVIIIYIWKKLYS